MGFSIGFSDAYARRDAIADAEERKRQYLLEESARYPDKVFYFDGSDGDDRFVGSDPWVRNEMRAQRLIQDEGEVEGMDKVQYKSFVDARGRTVRMAKDAGLGLSGADITIKGERATFLKKEIEVKGGRATGNVVGYYQLEGGGTVQVFAEKVAEGRHRMTVSKRYFSF